MLEVFPEVASGLAKTRFRAYQFAGVAVAEPLAIGVLSGTGLATPSF